MIRRNRIDIPAELEAFLTSVKRRRRVTELTSGLGWSLVVSALSLGLCLALDRFLILDFGARAALTSLGLLIPLVALARGVAYPLFRRHPSLVLARQIEAAVPGLQEHLVTVLEIANEEVDPRRTQDRQRNR